MAIDSGRDEQRDWETRNWTMQRAQQASQLS